MNENLIVEDNTIYEIDPECLKKKESVREKRAKKWKQKTLKSKKCKGEIDKIVIQVKIRIRCLLNLCFTDYMTNFNGILSAKGLPYVTVLFLRLENTGLTSSRIHSHFRLCRYRSRCHSSRE